MKTLKELCKEHFIKIQSVKLLARPDGNDGWETANASHYQVMLTFRGLASVGNNRKMTTVFSMGSAHTKPPAAHDVLSCLLSDASDHGATFEEWCDNLGYSSDSIKALKTFEAVQKNSKEVREFLGASFQEFVDAASES